MFPFKGLLLSSTHPHFVSNTYVLGLSMKGNIFKNASDHFLSMQLQLKETAAYKL